MNISGANGPEMAGWDRRMTEYEQRLNAYAVNLGNTDTQARKAQMLAEKSEFGIQVMSNNFTQLRRDIDERLVGYKATVNTEILALIDEIKVLETFLHTKRESGFLRRLWNKIW